MKILIADDEDYSREGLIESIDWEAFGITEVMQAVNGQEALKTAKWFRPDIVLTDIKMPKMDGIQFAEGLLDVNPESKIIFISGYMEIEYLKSAIRLSVVDYIEKPIDLNAVRAALCKAVADIRERQKNRAVEQDHRSIQRQALVSLLCGKDSDSKTIERIAKETGFPLNMSYVCLIVQHPAKAKASETDLEPLEAILRGDMGQAIGRYEPDKRQYQLIYAFPAEMEYRLSPLCVRILDNFADYKIGLGTPVSHYRDIWGSFRTAVSAVNCGFYQEDRRLFQLQGDLPQRRIIEPGIYGEFLQILSGQPQRLDSWFQDLFAELRRSQSCPKEQVYTLMTSMLMAFYRRYPDLYSWNSSISREEQIQPTLYGMESLREIEAFLQELLTWVRTREEEKSGCSRVVVGAAEYIAQHFGEKDLSVGEIAEHLHFSPAYLNVLFKQEMKMTIKQYLSNYRLERAKRLLEQDYSKVSEIADICGYASANYFSKVFREATGMSPAEYRNGNE